MRYGIIADVHSNIEALLTVMERMRREGVDKILCLGDIIGYNASPKECLEVLMAAGVECINGNHDRFMTGTTPIDPSVKKETVQVIEWTRGQVTEAQSDWLRGLPKIKVVDMSVLMVHGSPRHEDEYILTIDTIRENIIFMQNNYLGLDLCFFGHTHAPLLVCRGQLETDLHEDKTFKLEAMKTYLINPGSVGQPRDGSPKAGFGIFDTNERTVSYFRVDYDFLATQARIIAAGFDRKLARRLELGK